MNPITRELDVLQSYPRQMRVLLYTNLVYALVLPILELFVSAYIIRSSRDYSLVIFFQLAQGAGIPITFLLNAWLLNHFSISRLYAGGMILSGLSMVVMMMLERLTVSGTMITGFLMGLAYGFFWANRVYLALSNTTNQNRNYFYGLETFFFSGSFIIMPLLAGYFIATSQSLGWFGGNINVAYYILTGVVMLLTIAAGTIAQQGNFTNPVNSIKVHFKFHRLWNKMLAMSVLKGLTQGFIVTAPLMLIMKLVGDEGAVGSIQSIGSLFSAVLLYILGRKAKPEHRMLIFTTGLLLFLFGSFINMTLYSVTGVMVFIACHVFARPLLDMAYFPIQLGVTECVAGMEKRNIFSYIFSHEIGLFTGRLLGCGLFIFISREIGENIALRYALFAVAFIQVFSILLARSIVQDKDWCEPQKPDTQITDLKEPVEL